MFITEIMPPTRHMTSSSNVENVMVQSIAHRVRSIARKA